MNQALTNVIFGYDQTTNLLARAIISGRVPQALLVTGIPHLGKTSLARAFAMALNCTGENPPCNRCPSCRKISHQTHPDVTILDTPHEPLKIEQIRALQRDLSLKPYEGRYKIAILCDFERATLAAANALLKTLEEPSDHVVLILTAQKATSLLPTIVSRCQIINLKSVADDVIADVLQTHWSASIEEANLVSRLAAGRLGWAVTALSDPELLSRRQQYLTDLMTIMSQGYAFRLAYVQAFAKEYQSLVEMLNLWLCWWRDVMLIRSASIAGVVNVDLTEKLTWFANNLSTEEIVGIIKHINSALQNLEYNVNMRLNLEVLLLNLPIVEQGD